MSKLRKGLATSESVPTPRWSTNHAQKPMPTAEWRASDRAGTCVDLADLVRADREVRKDAKPGTTAAD